MNLVIHIEDENHPFKEQLLKSLPFESVHGVGIKEKVNDESVTHILRLAETGLSLQVNMANDAQSAPAPTQVDFLDAGLTHRRLTSGKSQGIAKAIGLKKLEAPSVLDATAGLGKDSFIMASLGCRVTLLERSAVVHALLTDGLQRGMESSDAEVRSILQAMTLVNTDALSWFRDIVSGKYEKPDVIYLDPMFPPRNKSAKVKKDISLLQQVLGTDDDFDHLLESARACAKLRVVVKRPGKASKKTLPKPSFQIEGKSAHFDVYV